MTVTYGWDASDFDWSRGPMDLAAARAAGIDFFTHKATEGTGTRHVHYGEALGRARAAGIPFLGAYHVVRSGPGIQAQVDYHMAYVNQATPWWRVHPWWFFQCDMERWPYDAVPAQRGVDFCNALAARTGRAVLLYASRGQYGDSIGGSAPLWNASYGTNTPGDFRALYPGDSSSRWARYSGRTPAILQYSSKATIGRQPTCDANAFRGSVQDLARLIGRETDGMSMLFDDNLARKIDAAYNVQEEVQLDTGGGTMETFKVPLVQVLTSVGDRLTNVGAGQQAQTEAIQALETRLDGLEAGAVSQEAINAAVAAALADPAVIAPIVAAIGADLAARLAS